MPKKSNIAFIDGQNLHLGTTKQQWKIDLRKFRIYLKDKYAVTEARYHLGFVSEEEQDLYTNLQTCGFVVQFREHSSALKGKKKGNVDTDIVFEAMKILTEKDVVHNIVLVSGDGDYRKLVDYLIEKKRFKKILFPNRKFASSLYKHLPPAYYDYLDSPGVRSKIALNEKRKKTGFTIKKKRSP